MQSLVSHSPSDIPRPKSAIILFSLQASFEEEISSMESGASGVRKTSDIYRLDPVLKDYFLRVGGNQSRSFT